MTLSCAPDAPGLSAQQAAPSPLTTSPFPAPSESLHVLGDTEVMVCLFVDNDYKNKKETLSESQPWGGVGLRPQDRHLSVGSQEV